MDNNSKHGMTEIIRAYYAETLNAAENAEKAHDIDKKSAKKKEVYYFCQAQCMALEELMDKLDIDYDDIG